MTKSKIIENYYSGYTVKQISLMVHGEHRADKEKTFKTKGEAEDFVTGIIYTYLLSQKEGDN